MNEIEDALLFKSIVTDIMDKHKIKTILELDRVLYGFGWQLAEKQNELKHLYSLLEVEAFGNNGDLVFQEASKEIARLQEKEELLKNANRLELEKEEQNENN